MLQTQSRLNLLLELPTHLASRRVYFEPWGLLPRDITKLNCYEGAVYERTCKISSLGFVFNKKLEHLRVLIFLHTLTTFL